MPAYRRYSIAHITASTRNITSHSIKIPEAGAGEMAQWLRTLAALVEELGSILRTHTEVLNCLLLRSQRSLFGLCTRHMRYTDIDAGKAPILLNRNIPKSEALSLWLGLRSFLDVQFFFFFFFFFSGNLYSEKSAHGTCKQASFRRGEILL